MSTGNLNLQKRAERFVEPEELCPVCGGTCAEAQEEFADEPDYEQDGCRA